MIHGYNLYVVPRDPAFRPTPEQVEQAVRYLVERLDLEGREFGVDGEDELPLGDALERLRAAAGSPTGGAECLVSFDDLVSGEIFGYDPESETPDENYWADELKIQINGAPFPYADWEYEDACCPKCGTRIEQIADLLVELRVSLEPVRCSCGAATPPHELRMTSGVRLAQFAVAFLGNRGWLHEVEDDREAFKDDSFLPALEEILGTDLEVLAVST